jgi:predicted nucleotidyltransferase
MKRADATQRLFQLIERLVSGDGMTGLVDRVWLYGSYARGALAVGDVDLSVEYTSYERCRRDFQALRAPI